MTGASKVRRLREVPATFWIVSATSLLAPRISSASAMGFDQTPWPHVTVLSLVQEVVAHCTYASDCSIAVEVASTAAPKFNPLMTAVPPLVFGKLDGTRLVRMGPS